MVPQFEERFPQLEPMQVEVQVDVEVEVEGQKLHLGLPGRHLPGPVQRGGKVLPACAFYAG